jgi:hypothetical protein
MHRQLAAILPGLRRAALLAVLPILWTGTPFQLLASQAAVEIVRPALTDEEIAEFLLNAKVVATKGVPKGVTKTRRATLSDGRMTHDAQIQTVDIRLAFFTPPKAPPEVNFKDTYRYNIAAYRLARLLGLTNVPVSVKRRIGGDDASVTWWIDDVLMDDGERRKKAPPGWAQLRTANQIGIMRVFDELIDNHDRNLGNAVWTSDGTMWMIDHTRTFRAHTKLKTPEALLRCERGLLDAIRTLTLERIKSAVGNSLFDDEIVPVIARRDAIVELFEKRIAERGEAAVLYTWEDR